MAIYRLSAKIVSRAKGQSAVAAAAYRSGEVLRDGTLNRTFDYSKKQGIEHIEILAPAGSPDWISDRERLWNEVELSETRKNSQLAREVQLALPRELSGESQLELARDFIQAAFVNQGMVADFAIHRDNPENPHVHVMLTLRQIGPDGFGAKRRDWNEHDLMHAWRLGWEKAANHYLAREGKTARIDRRSFRDRKLRLEPLPKLSKAIERFTADGQLSEDPRVLDYLAIARSNGEKIIAEPSIALKMLTEQKVTFRRRDVQRLLNRHTADQAQFRRAEEAIFGAPELILTGQNVHEEDLFTSKATIDAEKSLLAHAEALTSRPKGAVPRFAVDQAVSQRELGEEQEGALRHITEGDGHLAVVQGIAGSGKSYMLGAAREAWEVDGRRVLGAALAGKAAEGLELSSGIRSRSLASWEYAFEKKREELAPNDVFVIDEAGMVGTAMMERMIRRVEAAGAKLVLVGDSQQLQAIEAGSPFHKLGKLHHAATMTRSRRQKVEWQQKASGDFFKGRADDALKAYCDAGHFKAHQSQSDALDGALEAWSKGRGEAPKSTQLLLAYRRRDVRTLNQRAREKLKDEGTLQGRGKTFTVETADGTAKREFAEGDRIYFLKNSRALGVTNGTLATIEKIEGHDLVVTLDNGDDLAFNTKDYNALDHGYAATIHKAQGVTVDRTYVVADNLLDQHSAYVALSRHRDGVELHWSKEEFEGGEEQLLERLERHQRKEMICDRLDLETFRPLDAEVPSPALPDEPKSPPEAKPPEPDPKFAWFLKMKPKAQEAELDRLLDIYRGDTRPGIAVQKPDVGGHVNSVPVVSAARKELAELRGEWKAAKSNHEAKLAKTPSVFHAASLSLHKSAAQLTKAAKVHNAALAQLKALRKSPVVLELAEKARDAAFQPRLDAQQQRLELSEARAEFHQRERAHRRPEIEAICRDLSSKGTPHTLCDHDELRGSLIFVGLKKAAGGQVATFRDAGDPPSSAICVVDVTRHADAFRDIDPGTEIGLATAYGTNQPKLRPVIFRSPAQVERDREQRRHPSRERGGIDR